MDVIVSEGVGYRVHIWVYDYVASEVVWAVLVTCTGAEQKIPCPVRKTPGNDWSFNVEAKHGVTTPSGASEDLWVPVRLSAVRQWVQFPPKWGAHTPSSQKVLANLQDDHLFHIVSRKQAERPLMDRTESLPIAAAYSPSGLVPLTWAVVEGGCAPDYKPTDPRFFVNCQTVVRALYALPNHALADCWVLARILCLPAYARVYTVDTSVAENGDYGAFDMWRPLGAAETSGDCEDGALVALHLIRQLRRLDPRDAPALAGLIETARRVEFFVGCVGGKNNSSDPFFISHAVFFLRHTDTGCVFVGETTENVSPWIAGLYPGAFDALFEGLARRPPRGSARRGDGRDGGMKIDTADATFYKVVMSVITEAGVQLALFTGDQYGCAFADFMRNTSAVLARAQPVPDPNSSEVRRRIAPLLWAPMYGWRGVRDFGLPSPPPTDLRLPRSVRERGTVIARARTTDKTPLQIHFGGTSPEAGGAGTAGRAQTRRAALPCISRTFP